MNEKLAKRFRKMTMTAILAAEEAGAEAVPKKALQQINKTGTVINNPRSFRGAYRGMKKKFIKEQRALAS